jgi:predicted protein tyrosine phosphatase
MTILVCPLSRVADLVAERNPGRVISVLDPDMSFPDLGVAYAGRHLRLAFHDVHEAAPGLTAAGDQHAADLLSFLKEWKAGESLLVHCRAGIGRSTATAFVAACYRNPDVPELAIARELRRLAPLARPNATVIRLADARMNRGGRMNAAFDATFRGLPWVDVDEGVPFELPVPF